MFSPRKKYIQSRPAASFFQENIFLKHVYYTCALCKRLSLCTSYYYEFPGFVHCVCSLQLYFEISSRWLPGIVMLVSLSLQIQVCPLSVVPRHSLVPQRLAASTPIEGQRGRDELMPKNIFTASATTLWLLKKVRDEWLRIFLTVWLVLNSEPLKCCSAWNT